MLSFGAFFGQIWAKIDFLQELGSSSSYMMNSCNFMKKKLRKTNQLFLRKMLNWSTEDVRD